MEEMRVYVANLGKYNEGELVGAWFEPPIDYDEMAERIGLNEQYEEYAIHDYELPFEIGEYTPIEEVNRLCEMVADLPEYIQDNLKELQGYFSSLEDLCEHQDDIILWSGCEDMADVARQMVEEGALGEIPAHLQNYIDYEAYGRDLSFEGTFVETVVLLSHKKPDSTISVKVEFGEGEGKVPLDNISKRAEAYKPKERVTYKMIKEYIEAKYGFKVHTAYIAEVKRSLGLPMYDAPNAVEELKQPRKHPTAEKAEAIKDALKHFEVI